jgi:hypothetical protein
VREMRYRRPMRDTIVLTRLCTVLVVLVNVSIGGYDPTAAAIAQSNAAAQNEAMVASAIERGRQNLNVLERSVIKGQHCVPRRVVWWSTCV